MTTRKYIKRFVSISTGISSAFVVTLFIFPAFAFKSGYVEPVPGNTVLRSRSYPPTGGNFGGNLLTNSTNSRAAILQKLTSPRRSSIPLQYDSSINTGPSPTGLYSHSQSMEESHENLSASPSPTPFGRFPSPFSSISSTIPSDEKQHLHQRLHHYQRIQRQGIKSKPTPASITTNSNNLQNKEDSSSSDVILTSVDDLLDRGESLYTGNNDNKETTLTMMSKERYSSQETATTDGGDPYTKQSETSPVNTVEASSSPSSPHRSIPSSGSNSRSSKSLNLDDKDLPQTLLSPSYLSLAKFRHIDDTLEKSSGNILSRIANFWNNLSKDVVANNRTNIIRFSNASRKGAGNSNKRSGSNNLNKDADTPIITNLKDSTAQAYYTKLSDSSSIDIEDEYETDDNASLNNNINKKDNLKDNNHDDNDDNSRSNHQQRHRQHHEAFRHALSSSSGEKSESRREGGIGLQPDKYISIEDNNSEGGNIAAAIAAAKEQYLSLDDGGSIGSDGEENSLLNDHLRHHNRHHNDNNNKHENGNSVEDFITSESSVGFDDFDVSSDSHSFHEDLFHHTTGTITAVAKQEQLHEDLLGSGSSLKESGRKLQDSSPKSVNIIGSTGLAGGGVGNVKKAESDKIWSMDSHFGRNDLIESAEDEEHDFYYGMTVGGFLKRELWTIPLFVLAALNMVLIILFEVYVLCRARGQSRRHLFLGQMLLFGLFLCSFLALMFAVQPSMVGCFVGRLGLGITYSLIFSVLMVKCVFLLSLDSGVYLPTSYQGMLLFFAVLVQVAIDAQWAVIYPPFLQAVESGRSVLLQCGTSFSQLLYSLSYVGFLVLMVGFLAGRAAYKGVVENYRESVYILITAVVTVPVALSWTVAGWMLQGRHQDACVAFGLVAHSLTTFLIMFMPKGRQLASLDKEAVCFEDQEDQCSGYSPSFFHFKPSTKNCKTTLWGDGNLYTTLEPTVSTINPNVFFHRNDFHSGMIY